MSRVTVPKGLDILKYWKKEFEQGRITRESYRRFLTDVFGGQMSSRII